HHEIRARICESDQRAGRRPSQHDHACTRRPAGARNGHSCGLSRLCFAQDGHGDARRRRGQDQQARRKLCDDSRLDRRSGPRCGPLFLISRKADTEVVFDIDLARSQSEDNPVYYVQYAHARVCSVLKQAGIAFEQAPAQLANADLTPLASAYENALLRRLADFPAELAVAARDLAPHLITFYLKDLAQEFHSYYNAERFLVDDERDKRARLALVVAVGQVLRSGLAVLGIGAPEQM